MRFRDWCLSAHFNYIYHYKNDKFGEKNIKDWHLLWKTETRPPQSLNETIFSNFKKALYSHYKCKMGGTFRQYYTLKTEQYLNDTHQSNFYMFSCLHPLEVFNVSIALIDINSSPISSLIYAFIKGYLQLILYNFFFCFNFLFCFVGCVSNPMLALPFIPENADKP